MEVKTKYGKEWHKVRESKPPNPLDIKIPPIEKIIDNYGKFSGQKKSKK